MEAFYVKVACSITNIVGIISLCFIPESHYYLIEKNKHEKALQNLAWFRGLPVQSVATEMAEIEVIGPTFY